jgi:hypothetical protein
VADLKARNGEPIKCSKGHLVGRFLPDVPRDRNIEAEDLGLSDKGLITRDHGYECPECRACCRDQPRNRNLERAFGLGLDFLSVKQWRNATA